MGEALTRVSAPGSWPPTSGLVHAVVRGGMVNCAGVQSPAAQVWSVSAGARQAPSASSVRYSTESRKVRLYDVAVADRYGGVASHSR